MESKQKQNKDQLARYITSSSTRVMKNILPCYSCIFVYRFQSVLLLATDGNVMRLIEIVSNLVQARHEEALKWIFNKGLIKIILLRYPWRKFTDCPSNTQQIMEEVLLLILKVFDTLPHTIYAQYESPEKLRLDYELDTVFHIQWPNRIKDSLTNICTHLNLVISD